MNAVQAGELVLQATTAADLMTPNVVSVREQATVPEAVRLLTDRGISAAPVIDQAGRPIGVLSRTDILAHEREKGPARASTPGAVGSASKEGEADPSRVRDLMTPAVFSVTPASPAAEVVQQMAALNVQHLFVVDQSGALVGVIGALDVVRRLQFRPGSETGQ